MCLLSPWPLPPFLILSTSFAMMMMKKKIGDLDEDEDCIVVE